jgi:hypothetical protein
MNGAPLENLADELGREDEADHRLHERATLEEALKAVLCEPTRTPGGK